MGKFAKKDINAGGVAFSTSSNTLGANPIGFDNGLEAALNPDAVMLGGIPAST